MSLLSTLLATHPPKDRDTIIENTESLVEEIQDKKTSEEKKRKLRDELFYLHLGLVSKMCHKYEAKLEADDIITICLEEVLLAAERYEIEKGSERFSWPSFFTKRVHWAVNAYYFKHDPLVYVPKGQHEKGVRTTCEEFIPDVHTGEDTFESDLRESYPTRWEAAYQYEKAHTGRTDKENLELKIFKLHLNNPNKTKLAKHLKMKRYEIVEAIENVSQKLREFYAE